MGQLIKSKNFEIDYLSENEIILKAGSAVNGVSPSLTPTLKALRETSTATDANGIITTTCDLTFKSKSGAASFIQGAATNGKKYFEKWLKTTTASPAATAPSLSETKQAEPAPMAEAKQEKTASSAATDAATQTALVKDIRAFCIDFGYNPDNRVINSLAYVSNPSEFIVNAMELTGFDDELLEMASKKFESAEWETILKRLSSIIPSRDRTNKRLFIKYGAAGSGKTYDAEKEIVSSGQKLVKIVGSASADPSDLFTYFNPSSKKYELTEYGEAMTNGTTILIDEGNLYNSVVLARIQSSVDNSSVITDRGITINIKDGFKVIITMNLETNLGKTPLPSPLVSRAVNLENYDKRAASTFNVW